MESMVEPDNPQADKPKWLRRMERESWQPELIISGVAILGSLQLPELLDSLENYALLRFDRDTIFLAYIAIIYWRLLAVGLIFTFIFHFIVRALWIGLIGLNSVYPGGFKPNKKFSEDYQEKMRAEYGDIDGFIQRLDRLGSGIFGIAFGIAGTFTNFGLIALVIVFIHSKLMDFGLDPKQVRLMLGLLAIPYFILWSITMIGHTKSLRERKWVKRFQWPAMKLMSRLTYPVAGRYITTSTNLVTSYYADRASFSIAFVGTVVVISVAGIASVSSSPNIPLFVDDVYHRIAADSTRLPTVYSESAAYEGVYYSPQLVMASREGGGTLRVWLPLPERESFPLENNCALPVVERGELHDLGWRNRRNARTLACSANYFSFTVNGSPVGNPQMYRETYVNEAGEQAGIVAHFSEVSLRPGANLLAVSADYPHSETGAPRTSYLPFYLDE